MAENCNHCESKNQEMTKVIMSSADWQRNEQRHESREKRLVWVIVLLICLLVGSNLAWMIYENSFEDYVITQEVEQDADNGTNNFVGSDVYGETENQNND